MRRDLGPGVAQLRGARQTMTERGPTSRWPPAATVAGAGGVLASADGVVPSPDGVLASPGGKLPS